MEVWGRVLDLSQEEKNISQRTKSMWPGGYRATQKKKKPRVFLECQGKYHMQRTKGVRKQSQEGCGAGWNQV